MTYIHPDNVSYPNKQYINRLIMPRLFLICTYFLMLLKLVNIYNGQHQHGVVRVCTFFLVPLWFEKKNSHIKYIMRKHVLAYLIFILYDLRRIWTQKFSETPVIVCFWLVSPLSKGGMYDYDTMTITSKKR